jgi:hypothetical protein
MVGRSAPRPAEVGILIGRIRSLVVKTWTIGIEAPLTTTPENGQTLAAYGDDVLIEVGFRRSLEA